MHKHHPFIPFSIDSILAHSSLLNGVDVVTWVIDNGGTLHMMALICAIVFENPEQSLSSAYNSNPPTTNHLESLMVTVVLVRDSLSIELLYHSTTRLQ